VEFRRVHNQVRLVAVNTDFVAKAGTPEARAVAAGFSPSLVASTAAVSAAHPERKTVLVDANGLFVNDYLGLGMALQRNYRQGYNLDPRHSGIDTVRGKPDEVVFEITNHYYVASLAVPQPLPPGAPVGLPQPSVPESLPDARSMFFGLQYSLTKMPEQPMAARPADARVGYFTTTVSDFTTTSRARPSSATSTAGAWRRRTRRRRCPSRSSPSPSGSTRRAAGLPRAPSPRACWSGTRPSSASASRTRWS
jgi:hypothetical protein